MKKILFLTIFLSLFLAAGCSQTVGSRTVKLYYYDAKKDLDEAGNIKCSADGLVGVDRSIPVSKTPIQDTINLLLSGDLNPAERASGLTTDFPLAGVELKGTGLNDGQLTLNFLDPANKTGGGSCRVAILWAEISQTAKQFPEVKSVQFAPAELFQP